METPSYFLSSMENVLVEPVRACYVTRTVAFDTGKPAIEVRIDPVVIGQECNRSSDIDTVILANRHEGATIDPVTEFPCFVFVTIPAREGPTPTAPLHKDDLVVIAWGELYRTREDAEQHRFG